MRFIVTCILFIPNTFYDNYYYKFHKLIYKYTKLLTKKKETSTKTKPWNKLTFKKQQNLNNIINKMAGKKGTN